MRLMKVLVVILIATQSVSVFAGHPHNDYDHGRLDREKQQQRKHIEQGIKAGTLTRQEADILKHEQHALRQLERKLRKDGQLKPWEGRYLHARYAELRQHIRGLKQNNLYRHHHRRKKYKHPHYERHYDYQHGHYSQNDDDDDEVLLWTTLGVMGAVLVNQWSD